MSEHREALEFLKRNRRYYYSPTAIINMIELSLTDSTLGRKLRNDRANGLLKSRREYMDNGRYYVAYSHKRTK